MAAPTTAPPTDLQPSSEDASAVLIADWEAGRRSAARGVATATAVAELFGRPYRGEPLNDRGCSDFVPLVCSWGPYAFAPVTDALYEVYVAHSAGGWYVTRVVVEG